MKKIIDWCIKYRDVIYVSVLLITILLIYIDDLIMRNPHSIFYNVGCVVLFLGAVLYLYCANGKSTYWFIVIIYPKTDISSTLGIMLRKQKNKDLDVKDTLEFAQKRYNGAMIFDYVRISKHEFETKYNVLKMM